jgi:hypothetical protein
MKTGFILIDGDQLSHFDQIVLSSAHVISMYLSHTMHFKYSLLLNMW